jgi:limonene 1,2-monooxygenase
MDRSNYRVMAPFHIAETRERAIENVRAGFEKWQLYSYSVNPEGGAAIGMPSIEAINEGGRGAIGTPDDALRVLENYWVKTGGFGCILILAHDWADWEATKRSCELFARYVLPRFEERSAWLAVDGLDARQSRSLQRETQGRRRQRCRPALRRRAGENEAGSRKIA